VLHEHADTLTLGPLPTRCAGACTPGPRHLHVDRNLTPTNVCITDCGFCAFYRRPRSRALIRSRAEIDAKLDELAAIGGAPVLMQGGTIPT
jgi:cyclic dehypoxanthinyl futalosine synthase